MRLFTAVEKLQATYTEHPTRGEGYRYYDDASRAYYLAPEADMVRLGQMLLDGEDDAYSLWCSGCSHPEID